MQMLNAGPTLLERCRRVASDYADYLADPRGYWVAIARTQEWPNPTEPALRHPHVLRIPGIQLFVYVHFCGPCYYHPEGNVRTGERTYQTLEVTDYYSLVHAKAQFLYYEAEVAGALFHLNQSYRIVALCRKVRLINTTCSYSPGSVVLPQHVSQYEVLWVGSTRAIHPDSATLHRIQIIRVY